MYSPRWLAKPEQRLKDLTAEYNGNLRKIASRLAAHGKLDNVNEKHVDEAHEALVVSGLNLVPWYRRPQLKTSAGGVISGAALSVPGIVPLLPIDPKFVTPISWFGVILCVVVGMLFIVFGWLDRHQKIQLARVPTSLVAILGRRERRELCPTGDARGGIAFLSVYCEVGATVRSR